MASPVCSSVAASASRKVARPDTSIALMSRSRPLLLLLTPTDQPNFKIWGTQLAGCLEPKWPSTSL
eukprot:12816215-Heterocapsa_arctica.AAC.1